MDAAFCIDAVEEALARYGKPDIFNTDQGSQFTSLDLSGLLARHDIAISMDGKGAWRDNIFVERLWRSVKYEEVYLKAYDTVSAARASLGAYLAFYNSTHPHSAQAGRTPDEVWFGFTPAGGGSMNFCRRSGFGIPVGLRPPFMPKPERHFDRTNQAIKMETHRSSLGAQTDYGKAFK